MDIGAIFLDNPNKDFHIREIARIVRKSPTTVSKKLQELKKKKLLLSRNERNHQLYRANIQNNFFCDLKLYYNIKRIRESGLIEYLLEYYNYPSAIILFGSFQKAENVASSDIDLCIITAKESEPNLEKFEKKLKHKVQLFPFSDKKLQSFKNKGLLNNIINGVVLEGFLEVFR
jgi:predicted nucleotidyltransferase